MWIEVSGRFPAFCLPHLRARRIQARRHDAFLERLVPPPPKGTQATHLDLDGVKAVAVVTPASLSGRLVLYLHGGGHVSGSPALYGDFTYIRFWKHRHQSSRFVCSTRCPSGALRVLCVDKLNICLYLNIQARRARLL